MHITTPSMSVEGNYRLPQFFCVLHTNLNIFNVFRVATIKKYKKIFEVPKRTFGNILYHKFIVKMINNHLINKKQDIAIVEIMIFAKMKSAYANLCLQKRLKTDIVQLTNK